MQDFTFSLAVRQRGLAILLLVRDLKSLRYDMSRSLEEIQKELSLEEFLTFLISCGCNGEPDAELFSLLNQGPFLLGQLRQRLALTSSETISPISLEYRSHAMAASQMKAALIDLHSQLNTLLSAAANDVELCIL
jgi:hypothetical protein